MNGWPRRVEAESPFGDIWAYRQSIEGPRSRRQGRNDLVEVAMARLRPGQVVAAAKGRYRGPVVVVASAHRKGGMRLTTVTKRADLLLLTADDFDEAPRGAATCACRRRSSRTAPSTGEPWRGS